MGGVETNGVIWPCGHSGVGVYTAKVNKLGNIGHINTSTPSSCPGVGTNGEIWNYRISGEGEPVTIVGCQGRTYPKRTNISKNNKMAIKNLNNKKLSNVSNKIDDNKNTKFTSRETINKVNNNIINNTGRNKYVNSRTNIPYNNNSVNNNDNLNNLKKKNCVNRDIQSLSRKIPDHSDQNPRFRNNVNIYPHAIHEEANAHSQGDHSGKGQFHHGHNKYKPGQRCQYLNGYPDYGR